MNAKPFVLALSAVLVLGAGGYGLYQLGRQHASNPDHAAPVAASSNEAEDRRVLYWHDPMVPGHRFDKPGKSPFMDMQLVPVYADQGADDGTVTISPRVQQNLGVRTAEVVRGNLDTGFEAVGNVAYNERALVAVQARSNGFVEKLHVRATLDPVRRGQALVELYVPEWVAAQEEYLTVKNMQGRGSEDLLDAARQRMRLTGMDETQIRLVEKSGKVHARLTIVAPISGQLSELGVREGMTVAPGMPLFRINGIKSVWVYAELPEAMVAQVRPGTAVEVRTTSLPGQTFNGAVGAILPEVNQSTRTLRARIEVANRDAQLVPGMFASLRFATAGHRDVLLVPSEAVITTGTRNVVLLAQEEGRFAPAEVETGLEANGRTEIRKGLEAGQKVVTSGQFLIDSEASLKGATTRMSDAPASALHRGEAVVEDIDGDDVLLSHGPIPSLDWGEMTMGFKAPASGMPDNIGPGARVKFEFRQTDDGQFQIVTIAPIVPSAGSGK